MAKDLAELSALTGLEVSRLKTLLHSCTMSEIRAGSRIRWRWVPKESVTARYVPYPNHLASMS